MYYQQCYYFLALVDGSTLVALILSNPNSEKISHLTETSIFSEYIFLRLRPLVEHCIRWFSFELGLEEWEQHYCIVSNLSSPNVIRYGLSPLSSWFSCQQVALRT